LNLLQKPIKREKHSSYSRGEKSLIKIYDSTNNDEINMDIEKGTLFEYEEKKNFLA